MTRRLIALNNNGVESLRCGRFHEAMFVFRHALECAKSLCDMPHEGIRTSHARIPLFPASLNCLETLNLLSVSPNNMFDIYDCAFSLPKDESIAESVSDVLVVIIFNLALSQHLAGMCGNQEAMLSAALRNYKVAFSVFRSSSSTRTDAFAVFLGCLTNMGHIFSHYGQLQEADACYDTLDGLLNTPEVDSLSEQDEAFFFSLLSHRDSLTTHLAAAA